jgi:hypothetical protein
MFTTPVTPPQPPLLIETVKPGRWYIGKTEGLAFFRRTPEEIIGAYYQAIRKQHIQHLERAR